MRDSVASENSGVSIHGWAAVPGDGCAPGGSVGISPFTTRTATQVFAGLPAIKYLSRKVGHGNASGTGCGSPPKLSVIDVTYASNVSSAWNGGPKMWMSAPR